MKASDGDLSRERALFEAALDLEGDARASFLATECGPDSSLRRRVEALLSAAGDGDEILPGEPLVPTGSPRPTLTPSGMILERPGMSIGRYALLEEIGEGGCGIVYLAEQREPVRRRVALKILKPGMDTRSVVARFEAERQALALMDHPNIARVLDGGATETGRPFFVMELVRGVRITDFCDERRLSARERLALFVQVCQAIQHAHQKGVIHRDIKPSNILVTVNDDVPVPKVIDFGIAKATGQALTDKTLVTRFHGMIGTPAYMSPEQAAYAADILSARTALDEGNPGRARSLLAAYVPQPGETDLRGVEWRWLSWAVRDESLRALPHPGLVQRLALAPDGTRFATACTDGQVRIWDSQTSEKLMEIRTEARALEYSRDGGLLATVTAEGAVLRSTATWEVRRVIPGLGGPLVFAADGLHVFGVEGGRWVRWDLEGRERKVLAPPIEGAAPELAAAVGKDRIVVAARGQDSLVSVLSAVTGEGSVVLGGLDTVESVAGSADGRWVAAGNWHGTIAVWDARTGKVVARHEARAVRLHDSRGTDGRPA